MLWGSWFEELWSWWLAIFWECFSHATSVQPASSKLRVRELLPRSHSSPGTTSILNQAASRLLFVTQKFLPRNSLPFLGIAGVHNPARITKHYVYNSHEVCRVKTSPGVLSIEFVFHLEGVRFEDVLQFLYSSSTFCPEGRAKSI